MNYLINRVPWLPRLVVAAGLASMLASRSAQGAPNPYCVSGAEWSANGTMAKLNMPSDSLGYIWDNLYSTNIPNMVRPCRYWLLVWGGHLPHGYHETDDTLDDPTAFGQWVDANPGKIWIIGNEPNIYPQDGLTPAQYARMFKKYYDFILARDPSARFAVAGLAGDANPTALNANKDWWNQALGEYKTQFGADMPIDIWNCHGYRPVGDLNPDETMAEYFTPYRQFVDTVSGGIYAGKELWCTEFGVPGWSTTLDPSLLAEFVTQLLRLVDAIPAAVGEPGTRGNRRVLATAGRPAHDCRCQLSSLADQHDAGLSSVEPADPRPQPVQRSQAGLVNCRLLL